MSDKADDSCDVRGGGAWKPLQIDYGDPSTPFIDRQSIFSIGYERMGPVGLGRVYLRSTLGLSLLLEPCLLLGHKSSDDFSIVNRYRLESDACCARELAWMGGIHITTEAIFSSESDLLWTVVFRNTGDLVETISPVWWGAVSKDGARHLLPYFMTRDPGPRLRFVETKEAIVEAGFRSAEGERTLPMAFAKIEAMDARVVQVANQPVWSETESSGQGYYYSFSPENPVALMPGEERIFRFVVSINVETYCYRSSSRVGELIFNSDSLAERNLRDLETALGDCSLKQTFDGSRISRIKRARLGLLRNCIRARGGKFGERVALLCTPDSSDFSCVFFWDALFGSVALSTFAPKLACDAVESVFQGQNPDGTCPERQFAYDVERPHLFQAPMPPLGSWAVQACLNASNNREFLERMFPKLILNYRFWDEYCDVDRDGLAEIRWSGQMGDNSPIWDPFVPHLDKSGCTWLPPIASVAINAFLIREARGLADLATQLDRIDLANYYSASAEARTRALTEHCYCADEGLFWDYCSQTRTHTRVRTFFMFWPLIAGIPMEESVRRYLIEQILLDPEQFFGAVPFPSVAYNEPSYDPRGYWRGRAWPHISYWLVEVLAHYGYSDYSNRAANRLITRLELHGRFAENLCTDPLDTHSDGFQDYVWGLASYCLLAGRHYLPENGSSVPPFVITPRGYTAPVS